MIGVTMHFFEHMDIEILYFCINTMSIISVVERVNEIWSHIVKGILLALRMLIIELLRLLLTSRTCHITSKHLTSSC